MHAVASLPQHTNVVRRSRTTFERLEARPRRRTRSRGARCRSPAVSNASRQARPEAAKHANPAAKRHERATAVHTLPATAAPTGAGQRGSEACAPHASRAPRASGQEAAPGEARSRQAAGGEERGAPGPARPTPPRRPRRRRPTRTRSPSSLSSTGQKDADDADRRPGVRDHAGRGGRPGAASRPGHSKK